MASIESMPSVFCKQPVYKVFNSIRMHIWRYQLCSSYLSSMLHTTAVPSTEGVCGLTVLPGCLSASPTPLAGCKVLQ